MFKKIDNIIFDIKALSSISHYCNPVICSTKKCCCQSYEICIDNKELKRIIDFIPFAAAFSESLKSGKSFKNVFDKIDSNTYSIDQKELDHCVFTYFGRKGEVLCSLHSAAKKWGYKPDTIKPKVCTLWPLALTDSKPCYLTVDEDAFSFPCNTLRKSNDLRFNPNIESIIEKVFGLKYLFRLFE